MLGNRYTEVSVEGIDPLQNQETEPGLQQYFCFFWLTRPYNRSGLWVVGEGTDS